MAQPDFTLYDRIGRRKVVVEVKSKRGTSEQWAAEFRRNLLAAHEEFQDADFFVIATPDRVYLWRERAEAPSAVRPDYVLDGSVFRPYTSHLDEMNGDGFLLVVMSWLSDLMRPRDAGDLAEGDRLSQSGLLESVRNGKLTYPTAA